MKIGLTGYMASGKGEIANILMEQGYKYISLSDMVREEADVHELEHTRENLQRIGNRLREEFGGGVLGMRVREKIEKEDKDGNWVIDGVRNPAEAKELMKLDDFHFLGIVSDPEIIVERVMSRARDGEQGVSEDEILAKLDVERGKNQPENGQQVDKCIDMIDFLILNNGTMDEMKEKFDHFVGLLNGTDRPNFHEVFMGVAYQWTPRSTCLRRRVGAVIAKDNQQLTTGYNGAPKGVPHCAEQGGCLREKLGIPSGQRHEICRGTHAEQNAITQAAKFGINIKDSVLYTTTHPCVICTKMILNAGIKKVYYDGNYNDELSKEILGNQTGVELIRYEGKMFRR